MARATAPQPAVIPVHEEASIERFVLISGCSGGGKSTLLAELRRRGFATVEEPGRQIVREEMLHGGAALPWIDAVAFLRRALAISVADLAAAASQQGWVFFDRGLIDAAVALAHLGGEPLRTTVGDHRCYSRVFLAPPWRDIFQSDDERPHGFAEAVAEYERLREAFPALGYQVITLPKISVEARAVFILSTLRTRD